MVIGFVGKRGETMSAQEALSSVLCVNDGIGNFRASGVKAVLCSDRCAFDSENRRVV